MGQSADALAPTGRYEEGRLLNVGAHRWATKLELGYMVPLRPRWLLELDAGAWFFGDDEDFLEGRREQAPILALQAHLVRRFQPGFWASLDVNYFRGGRQTIGGNGLEDVQQNSRVGGTVVVPFRGRHAIRIGYFIAWQTAFGADFDQLLVSYQVLF